jgi:bifunctional N-acetylglucosamine-1-phosphate-uridyltransferase/glucosamine-1-phosphate-acetyltransferase GlmU-like protein
LKEEFESELIEESYDFEITLNSEILTTKDKFFNKLISNINDNIKNDMYIDFNNTKNEYYLTDIVKIISKDNVVDAVVVPYDYHLIGINDQNTLLFVENEFKNAVK